MVDILIGCGVIFIGGIISFFLVYFISRVLCDPKILFKDKFSMSMSILFLILGCIFTSIFYNKEMGLTAKGGQLTIRDSIIDAR